MRKNKNINYNVIIKYVLLFLLYLLWFLIIQPIDYDEIWNYGFSYSMAKGFLPYRDFNMVITPLFNFLLSLPFHFFGGSILVFHIEGAFIFIMTAYLLFKLIGDKAYLVLSTLFFLIAEFFPNYNFFCFTILLLIILLEKKDKNYDFLIGLLVGIEILSKQTIGLCLTIPLFLMVIKDKKRIIKRLEGLLVPLFIFCIYLLFTNTYKNFIDLCVLGLVDFTKHNTFTKHILIYILILIISIYVCLKNKNNKINYYILCYYVITLPEFDLNHITFSIIGLLVLIFMNFEINEKVSHVMKYCSIGLIVASVVFSFTTVTNFDIDSYPNRINNFEFRYIKTNNLKTINKVQNKIREYGIDNIVFIGCSESYMLKIMNDKKIEYTDLLNNANWGYNSHNKQINYIKKNKNKIYFVDEIYLNPEVGLQLDSDTVKYIVENAKKIDKVNPYNIYKFE